MADGKLLVVIGAEIDDFIKDTEKAFKSLKKQAKIAEDFGKDMTKYVTVPSLLAGAAFVKMAADEEASAARLKTSLTNVGISFDKAGGPIMSYVSALERASGFDDSSIQDAFSNLTTMTGDAKLSLVAMSAATDLARAKQMDLGTASTLVGKALNGNTDMLKRYGIEVREGATQTEVLQTLMAKFGGSSSEYMKTAAGQMANLKNQAANAAEAWGNVLMPAAMKLVGVLTSMADKAQGLANWFNHLSPNAKAFAGAIALVLVGIGPLIVLIAKAVGIFTTLRPLLASVSGQMALLGVQIAFLAVIALVVVANWEKVKSMLSAIFYGIVSAYLWLVESFVKGLALLSNMIPVVGSLYQALANKVGALSEEMGLKFSEAAGQMEQGGAWMGNTVEMVGGAMNSLMERVGATGTSFSDLAVRQKAALDGMGANTDQGLAKQSAAWKAWADGLKVTVQQLASGIYSAMAGAVQGITDVLTSGSGDWRGVLLNFLKASLAATTAWAIAKMTIFENMSKALAAAISGPWGWLIIGGLIAATIAVGSSTIPAMADGGVVNGPTTALIGEAGPEAVIPLSSPRAKSMISGDGGGMGSQTIVLELDGRVLAESTVEGMPAVLRMQGMGA